MYVFRTKGNQFLKLVVSIPLIQQAEGAASLENSCESGIADKKEAKSASTEDRVEEENKEEIKNPPVETLSVEIQTDPITDHELLSSQQQKL